MNGGPDDDDGVPCNWLGCMIGTTRDQYCKFCQDREGSYRCYCDSHMAEHIGKGRVEEDLEATGGATACRACGGDWPICWKRMAYCVAMYARDMAPEEQKEYVTGNAGLCFKCSPLGAAASRHRGR